MDLKRFFDLYMAHLRAREETIRSFIVTTAPELWFSLEAAALIDRSRGELGLGPASDHGNAVPEWLVGAERRKCDIWLESNKGSIAIEFKVIHNNKNFYDRLSQLRQEVGNGKVGTDGRSKRVGVAIFVYHSLLSDQLGNYAHRGGEGINRVSAEQCIKEIDNHLAGEKGTPRLRKVAGEMAFELDGAHYTENDRGAALHVSLWIPGP